MSVLMKIVFSLSLSGSILILVLLLCKPVYKNKLSRQWQYYIWLVVIARLLFPVASGVNAVGTLFSHMNQGYWTDSANMPISAPPVSEGDDAHTFQMTEDTVIQDWESGKNGSRAAISERAVKDMGKNIFQNLWIPWLVIALLLLTRKITVYQGFVRYIKAGRREISDTALLDRLAQIGEQAGVRCPVELYVNSLVSSPLLVVFFRPCIILPTADLSEVDFTNTVWHELIHYKRKDLFYKWLVQLVICLHWFNPLVWLMGWEINRACEFSCDAAVLAVLSEQERCTYGDTLLRAVGAGGNYKNFLVSVTLNESAELLKERLSAIKAFKRRSKAVIMLTAVFTVVMMMGATAMGAYVEPVRMVKIMTGVSKTASNEQAQTGSTLDKTIGGQSARDKNSNDQSMEDGKNKKSLDDLAEQYYQKNLLIQFGAVFSALDEPGQRKWLDTIYADDNITFFSVALNGLANSSPLLGEYMEKTYEDDAVDFFSVLVSQLSGSSPLTEEYAKRAYGDGAINFFAVLVNNMGSDLLKKWQYRAMEENMDIGFWSVLLNVDDDDMESWVDKAQKEDEEQYLKWGITRENSNFYYQGQLVHLFYDKYDAETVIRTININPLGTVDVKVTRNIRNKILSVDYMTEEEVIELFGTDALFGIDCGEEDFESEKWSYESKEDKFEAENEVFRLTVEELPDAVIDQMQDNGAIKTWYVYHCEGRKYLCYRGFAWNYAYQPVHDEEGWQINIQRLHKKDYGDVLLSLPDNGSVKVYCDGQKVGLVEIEE